jgi:thiol-disulfide isomerase/thioredoxin
MNLTFLRSLLRAAGLLAAGLLSLSPLPAATLGVGAVAPDFVMKTLAGADVRLSDFKDKVVVLDFWATWCGPCLASFPHTQALAAKYKDQGVVVLASGTSDTAAKFRDWIPANQPKYPDLVFAWDPNERGSATYDERASSKLYGVTGIPTQFVVGRDGRIAGVIVGNGGPTDPRTEAALARAGIKVDAAIVAQADARAKAAADAAAERAKNPPPPFRESYGKLKAGDTVPDFAVITSEGKPGKFSDFARGKTVVLDFWATWCGPCQQAMPHYQDVSRRYADKNVIVLGVCSFDTREAYDKWVVAHRQKYTFPTVFDPIGKPASGDREASAKTVMVQLTRGVMSPLPTTLVINPEGKFVGMYTGYSPAAEEALANLLMLAGVDLAPADRPKTFFPAGSSLKPVAPKG